jgi:predicted outer membrane repeat protein
VGIYGGFNGTETLRTQRNPVTNVTRLSGDIGDTRDWSDNSYHVVTGGGTNSTAVLDGFTIYAGNANVISSSYFLGGGMYNEASSPTLANLIFSNNWTTGKGGGMYNNNSSPTLTNVIFNGNTADSHGGGMYNDNSSPSLTNITFNANQANGKAGGLHNYFNSSPSLTNVTFSGNTAGTEGGGMVNWNNCSPTLVNVTFSANSALLGGGMDNTVSSSPSLTNVTFSGNTAGTQGGAMYNNGGAPEIYDSIFWGNGSEIFNYAISAEIHDSIVAGGCPANSSSCSNIINANPNLGALTNNGGFTQTMALGAGSAALDAGNNATCALTDQRGVTRPQGWKCDMGSFEVIFHKLFLPIILRN